MTKYDAEILQKIESNTRLTQRELSMIPWEHDVVDTIKGENRRWSRSVTTVFLLGDKTFALDWEQGLTEMQENEFHYQPYEVKKITKTITVIDWKEV